MIADLYTYQSDMLSSTEENRRAGPTGEQEPCFAEKILVSSQFNLSWKQHVNRRPQSNLAFEAF